MKHLDDNNNNSNNNIGNNIDDIEFETDINANIINSEIDISEFEKESIDERKKELSDLKDLDRVLTKLLINSEIGLKFNNFFTNTLNDTVAFDIAFDHALNRFKIDNHENQLINIDSEAKLKGLKDKISELFYLDRIISLSGLDPFRDEIMANHVDSLFSKNIGVKQSAKNKSNKQKLSELLDSITGNR